MKAICSALFLGLAACLSTAAQSAPLKVVVCAGQSNMVGDGNISQLPNVLKQPQPKVLFFDAGAWSPMSPGQTSNKPSKFGPEISLGHRLQSELGEPIGIIKHSVGTTSLAVDWSPAIKDSLYQQLLAKVKSAQESRDIEIVAMLWMQGERDTTNAKWAEDYASNLSNLIETARKDFNSPDMYFIAGRVNPPGRKLGPFVRKAQTQCTADGYAWIDCDDLAGAKKIHYTSAGYVQMGYKFADRLLQLRTGRPEEGSGQAPHE